MTRLSALNILMPGDYGCPTDGFQVYFFLNVYDTANPGQTNQCAQGIVRAESGHCATIH